MTAPREFWIPAAVGGFYDGKEVNFAVGPIVDGHLPNPGGILVREILPIDWDKVFCGFPEISERTRSIIQELVDRALKGEL